MGAVLALALTSVASAGQPTRIVAVLLDVRAEWGRTVSSCVTEGVFFGFHSGTSVYADQGASVNQEDDTAGVWWWQTDACDDANSFFYAADVHLEAADFFIDRQLGSAWVNTEIPVSNGTNTYLFSFDLAYTASGDASVSVVNDGRAFTREDRAVAVDITGTPTSDIPGGFTGFALAWANMGSLTQIWQ
jgi:hypothetical protein